MSILDAYSSLQDALRVVLDHPVPWGKVILWAAAVFVVALAYLASFAAVLTFEQRKELSGSMGTTNRRNRI